VKRTNHKMHVTSGSK